MGGSPCPLQQAGQVFGTANLHYPLHGLKVHSQIQGRGAHHPFDVAGFYPRLDGLATFDVNGPMVQGNFVGMVGNGKGEGLEPPFCLVAGVGENQGGFFDVQGRHQASNMRSPRCPAQGKGIHGLGANALDHRCPAGGWPNDHRGRPQSHGGLGGFFQIAQGGRESPGAEVGLELIAAVGHAQLRLGAPLGTHQFMPFIQHHAAQMRHRLAPSL
jgi:hypothetical protein